MVPNNIPQSSLISIILSVLNPQSEFIFLMGSADTPRFRPDSDVDIAFFPKEKINFSQLIKIQSELELALARDVDLISLNGIDPIFGRQVLETGRIISVTHPEILLSWKAHQLSIYPDFKRSRAVIEKNLLKRKRYV